MNACMHERMNKLINEVNKDRPMDSEKYLATLRKRPTNEWMEEKKAKEIKQ